MLSISSLKAARCAGIGVTAESLVVLGLSTASCEARPPPSEDGGEARRGHRRLADDRGAVGEGIGSLPTMDVEEVAVDCTANLKRTCGRAAACVVTLVRGLVDGFVEGKSVGGLLRADDSDVMPNPRVWWAGAAAAP